MKTLKKMFCFLIAAGIIFILGTAGASDIGMISLKETVWRVFVGMILVFAGCLGRKGTAKISVKKEKNIPFFIEKAA